MQFIKNLTQGFPTITGIRWFNLSVLVITPILSLYGLLYVPILRKTVVCTALYYIYSMLGRVLQYSLLSPANFSPTGITAGE
jgi:stearoyl-CoA desaturase (delta-9 desaturase)